MSWLVEFVIGECVAFLTGEVGAGGCRVNVEFEITGVAVGETEVPAFDRIATSSCGVALETCGRAVPGQSSMGVAAREVAPVAVLVHAVTADLGCARVEGGVAVIAVVASTGRVGVTVTVGVGT